MGALSQRLKTRVPSWSRFISRAAEDKRAVAYDLLPLLALPQRDAISRNLARLKPKTASPVLSPKVAELHGQLVRDGLTDMQPPLPEPILGDIVRHFKTTLCHDPYRAHLGKFSWDQPPSDEVNIGYFTWQEVITAPHMMALVNDPDILAVAELYLGCKPTIDNIGCAWSYNGRDVAKGVQRFHRDFDCTRSFKAFYYLTDIDENSGPHAYVRGSHRSRILDTGKAQTDEAIERNFGAESIAQIMGSAGSWFLEDVYGFHKGVLPQDKPRLLLAIEYNLYPSPLSPRSPILPCDHRYDPYINRLFVEP